MVVLRTNRFGRRLGGTLLAGCCALLAAAPVAHSQPGATTAAPRAVLTRLSNLHSLSRWAYPNTAGTIRASHSRNSRAVGKLRFLTTDDQAELYVVLASARLRSGAVWLQ